MTRMRRTVLTHVYNEEFLIPWWCEHHKKVFDHGIIFDYDSIDRTKEIIKEICPTWEVHTSRNRFFDGLAVDAEISDAERELDGWRISINATEFVFGNFDRLEDTTDPTQYFLTNYVFADMEDPSKTPPLTYELPLHEQRYWGYHDTVNEGKWMQHTSVPRMNRSIHNYPVTYTPGRHWPGTQYSFDDLVIFNYGYADIGERGLQRRLQIRDRMNVEKDQRTAHHRSREQTLMMYRADQQPKCSDLRPFINLICKY